MQKNNIARYFGLRKSSGSGKAKAVAGTAGPGTAGNSGVATEQQDQQKQQQQGQEGGKGEAGGEGEVAAAAAAAKSAAAIRSKAAQVEQQRPVAAPTAAAAVGRRAALGPSKLGPGAAATAAAAVAGSGTTANGMGGLQQQIHQVLAKLQGARERQQEVALAQQQQQEQHQQELEQQRLMNQQQQQEEQQQCEEEAIVGELEVSSLGDAAEGLGSGDSVPAASLAAASALEGHPGASLHADAAGAGYGAGCGSGGRPASAAHMRVAAALAKGAAAQQGASLAEGLGSGPGMGLDSFQEQQLQLGGGGGEGTQGLSSSMDAEAIAAAAGVGGSGGVLLQSSLGSLAEGGGVAAASSGSGGIAPLLTADYEGAGAGAGFSLLNRSQQRQEQPALAGGNSQLGRVLAGFRCGTSSSEGVVSIGQEDVGGGIWGVGGGRGQAKSALAALRAPSTAPQGLGGGSLGDRGSGGGGGGGGHPWGRSSSFTQQKWQNTDGELEEESEEDEDGDKENAGMPGGFGGFRSFSAAPVGGRGLGLGSWEGRTSTGGAAASLYSYRTQNQGICGQPWGGWGPWGLAVTQGQMDEPEEEEDGEEVISPVKPHQLSLQAGGGVSRFLGRHAAGLRAGSSGSSQRGSLEQQEGQQGWGLAGLVQGHTRRQHEVGSGNDVHGAQLHAATDFLALPESDEGGDCDYQHREGGVRGQEGELFGGSPDVKRHRYQYHQQQQQHYVSAMLQPGAGDLLCAEGPGFSLTSSDGPGFQHLGSAAADILVLQPSRPRFVLGSSPAAAGEADMGLPLCSISSGDMLVETGVVYHGGVGGHNSRRKRRLDLEDAGGVGVPVHWLGQQQDGRGGCSGGSGGSQGWMPGWGSGPGRPAGDLGEDMGVQEGAAARVWGIGDEGDDQLDMLAGEDGDLGRQRREGGGHGGEIAAEDVELQQLLERPVSPVRSGGQGGRRVRGGGDIVSLEAAAVEAAGAEADMRRRQHVLHPVELIAAPQAAAAAGGAAAGVMGMRAGFDQGLGAGGTSDMTGDDGDDGGSGASHGGSGFHSIRHVKKYACLAKKVVDRLQQQAEVTAASQRPATAAAAGGGGGLQRGSLRSRGGAAGGYCGQLGNAGKDLEGEGRGGQAVGWTEQDLGCDVFVPMPDRRSNGGGHAADFLGGAGGKPAAAAPTAAAGGGGRGGRRSLGLSKQGLRAPAAAAVSGRRNQQQQQGRGFSQQASLDNMFGVFAEHACGAKKR